MFDQRVLDCTAWLAEPGAIRQAVAKLRLFPSCPSAREIVEERRRRLDEARQAAARAIKPARGGKVGLIAVHGPIQQRMTSELMKLGGTSTEEVGMALDALLADPGVEAVVFHVDSPGGSSYGVEELSDKIYASRERKKTYAVADSMAASAAYWIATAAETVVCTPGGDVGSVGVYAIHVDQSKALEAEGLTVSLVKAGKYKAELAPFGPLGEEARAHLQELVDATYGKFVKAVARNRGVSASEVRDNYGQGRILTADKAKAVGMVDRIMPFDQFIAKLTGSGEGGRQASAELLRRRMKHEREKEEAAQFSRTAQGDRRG